MTVELSCGAGPVLVVLETGQPLLLDCHLGATPLDTPLNITWLQDGLPVLEGEGDSLRTLANGSLLVLPTSVDGRTPQGVEGGYSCVSAGPFGALTSRTITVYLASEYYCFSDRAGLCPLNSTRVRLKWNGMIVWCPHIGAQPHSSGGFPHLVLLCLRQEFDCVAGWPHQWCPGDRKAPHRWCPGDR